MAAIIYPKQRDFIRPRFERITPYQLYLEQIRNITDGIRYEAKGLEHLPVQFGGLKGQRQTINEQVVLQLIDFQIVE